MQGVYSLFDINARLYPNKIALVDGQGVRYSYREVKKSVNALSWSLKQNGVEPDTHVAFMFKNGIEFIVSFYAILKLGGVAIPFASSLTLEEISRNLSRAQCSVFLFDSCLLDKEALNLESTPLREVAATHMPISSDEGAIRLKRFEDLLEQGDPSWEWHAERSSHDDELILFTSGSTGEPKCVVHSHEGTLMFFSLAMMSETTFRHDDVMAYYAPLYHLAGMSYLMYIFSLGATLVLLAGFDADSLLTSIEHERVTQAFIIPPTLIYKMHEKYEAYDLSSMRWVICSGGASGKAVAEKVFEMFPKAGVSNTYGQSERAANTIICLTREGFERNPVLASSVGHATQFSEIRLVGRDGKDSSIGEAYARCPGMFTRYEGLDGAFVNGWFPTGDMLRRDDAGNYWFVDRVKDMIKTGGENVFSPEVEQVISLLPEVAECAVFALPDRYFDEAVSAAIVPAKDVDVSSETAKRALADKITDWCRHRMAAFKRPRNIFFVDTLPKNSLGKLQKGELRKRYWYKDDGSSR